VRARLIGLLVVLLGGLLAALTVPFAQDVVAGRQQAMYVDRLQDTMRFASAAQDAVSETDEQGLRSDLIRFADVYGISIAVLDRLGASHASGGPLPDLRQPAVADAFHQALAGHPTSNPPTIWPWSDGAMVVAVPVIRANDVVGVVLMVSSTERIQEAIARWLEIVACGEVISLTLLVTLSLRLASWVLRPVYLLDEATHQVSSGKLSTRVHTMPGPVELRRLTTSFNRMVGTVERAMERQRAFVADASHQLRNPLAALLLRLDALGMSLGRPHREELELVHEEASRLVNILDELLELATAQHLRAEPAEVDLVELVHGRLAAWRPMAQRRGITLHGPDGAVMHALVDPVLFGSALDAVLDNAVKFSPAGGQVDVSVVAQDDSLRVDVRDEGPGLAEDELPRVGDRFWRGAGNQNVPGSGLGLSIARTLLDATGGQLVFAPGAPGDGLRVSLFAPTAGPSGVPAS
jgi:signal transduction histidine kinase